MTKPQHTQPLIPVHRWQALWPVIDDTIPLADLIAEAIADLPTVARRHGYLVVDHAEPVVCPGRRVPGSGGALNVVTCLARVVVLRDAVEQRNERESRPGRPRKAVAA